MREALFTVAGALALAGCGGKAGPTGPCAAHFATCIANQQICVVEGGAPACQPCESGHYAAASNACEPIGGTAMAHDFPEHTVMPGEEVLGLCQSWTLGNATELWVNAVELSQNVASHHSNWTFVPSDKFAGPDGTWRCRDRQYDQLTAAVTGGVLFAQSTQATREVQKFPAGAAVRVPPWSRIISDVHLLNAARTPVTGRARLTIYALPAGEVRTKLVPFHLTYRGLDLPPRAASRFTGACDLDTAYRAIADIPFDEKVYYILPHGHALLRRFFVSVLGGARGGTSLLEVEGAGGEARGRAYDPPIDLTGSAGLTFGCEFDNPRDVSVGWGFGDQEMCELLGFGDSRLAFESTVSTALPAGNDGATRLFTGECGSLAFEWNHRKPGGPPP